MAMPKIYIDACCIIEAVKGRRGLPLQHPAAEVDMIERIMRAANDGVISLQTSMPRSRSQRSPPSRRAFSMERTTMRELIIHLVAKALGILIHIEGRPFGSSRRITQRGGGPCGGVASTRAH